MLATTKASWNISLNCSHCPSCPPHTQAHTALLPVSCCAQRCTWTQFAWQLRATRPATYRPRLAYVWTSSEATPCQPLGTSAVDRSPGHPGTIAPSQKTHPAVARTGTLGLMQPQPQSNTATSQQLMTHTNIRCLAGKMEWRVIPDPGGQTIKQPPAQPPQ